MTIRINRRVGATPTLRLGQPHAAVAAHAPTLALDTMVCLTFSWLPRSQTSFHYQTIFSHDSAEFEMMQETLRYTYTYKT
jgi:hypothetical protein